jgi:hypothetical protein
MSNKDKKIKLYDLFHGDPNGANRVSLVDHIFAGLSHFAGVYEDEVTNETGVKRFLKHCLTRDPKSCYVAGQDIKEEALHVGTLAKTDYVIAKTLWNLATDTLCECKKALAIARNGGKPPSGKNYGGRFITQLHS